MIHGLLNTQDNKFYIVSNDYHIIKTLQLLTMKHRLFLCVNISKLTDLSIDSDNCHEYGVSKPLTKFLTPDVDTSLYGAAIVDSPVAKNETLHGNIKTLEKIVSSLENFTAQYEARQNTRYEEAVAGLKELELFVKDIIPGDPVIEDFVYKEIEIKTNIIKRARAIKSRIFHELMSVDPWNKDSKSLIKERLNSVDSIDIELFTMMKNICLEKL